MPASTDVNRFPLAGTFPGPTQQHYLSLTDATPVNNTITDLAVSPMSPKKMICVVTALMRPIARTPCLCVQRATGKASITLFRLVGPCQRAADAAQMGYHSPINPLPLLLLLCMMTLVIVACEAVPQSKHPQTCLARAPRCLYV